MFCFQCQEAANNFACTKIGICGKDEIVSDLQDLLIYSLKGLAYVLNKANYFDEEIEKFIPSALFATITNVNFDKDDIINYIKKAVSLREDIKEKFKLKDNLPKEASWSYKTDKDIIDFALSDEVRITKEKNEDIRSLKELITYGLKGIGAYYTHAKRLGFENKEIIEFIIKALSNLITLKDVNKLFELAMETGKYAVSVLELLDKANTSRYGHPEITKVSLGVRNRPGILISGHDLKDLEELLEQSKDAGVDIYTHCEMLPAHYYPFFKKYKHFAGNYGGAWHKQTVEFEKFNGPIVMTTNCLVPPKDTYKDRVYVTNEVGFPGLKRIPVKPDGKKDFSQVIEHAKKCKPPMPLEDGEIIGGFAHNQVLSLADKILEAVKAGKIRKFVVMAGCDGRHKTREYYTEFAKKLPKDTVILTCGCAKFRFIKEKLGDIDGIPRVLDAGQCNDSYSLVRVALALKDALNLKDINDLPIAYNISWYEQKAVAVLLALLYLGVKNIILGPTLPAFLSENVKKVLAEKFGISTITTVEEDMKRLSIV